MDDSIDKTLKAAAVIVVTLLVMLVCFIAGAASAFGGILWLGEPPDDVVLTIHTPEQVEVGEDVLIEVIVKNNSTQPTEFTRIDISTGYLDGIDISSSAPAFESTVEGESLGLVYRTYYFYQDIAPGESLTVTLEGKAGAEGNYAGEIDVWFGFGCFNNIFQTIVR